MELNLRTKRVSRAFDIALLSVAGAVVLWWRWNAWLDPYVDFGRELYVPWRLANGAVLYQDIAYHAGPLSPHMNAGIFYLFGARLQVLIWTNILIAAGVTTLLYMIMDRLAGRLYAVAGAMIYLLLFMAAQYNYSGNFNWITPYSHEMTHGLLLALASILFMHQPRAEEQRPVKSFLAGTTCGLVFLTKPEIFVALLAANAVIIFKWAWTSCRNKNSADQRRMFLQNVISWVGGGGAILVMTFLAFLFVQAPGQALKSTCGAWIYVFGYGNLASPYFQAVMGTENVLGNVIKLAGCLGMLGVFTGLALVGQISARYWSKRTTAAVASGLMVLTIPTTYVCVREYGRIWRVLPIAVLGIFLVAVKKQFFTNAEEGSVKDSLLLAFAAFAGGLLLKILLYARLVHYGFALALPATVLLAVTLLKWTPEQLGKMTQGKRGILRGMMVGLLCGAILYELVTIHHVNQRMQSKINWEGQEIRFDPSIEHLGQALHRAKERMEPGATLTVIPETELLNFLLKRPSPLPYGNYNPHQILVFGEDQILAAFASNPPDYIVMIDRPYPTFGEQAFGQSYAVQLGTWIHQNYDLVEVLAPNPLPQSRAPILLLKLSSQKHHGPRSLPCNKNEIDQLF